MDKSNVTKPSLPKQLAKRQVKQQVWRKI